MWWGNIWVSLPSCSSSSCTPQKSRWLKQRRYATPGRGLLQANPVGFALWRLFLSFFFPFCSSGVALRSWEVTQPLWFPLWGEGGMKLNIPSGCRPCPACPGHCSLSLEVPGGHVLVRRGAGSPGVRARLTLWCSCQRRNPPRYPAVFTASAHVLSVSVKATSGANLRLSPGSVCSFCMEPDRGPTEKPPQRSAQTPLLPFRLRSALLRSEPLLPLSAGAFERLLIERINPSEGCKRRFTLSLGRTGVDQADLGAGELPAPVWHACPGWRWERFLQNCYVRHLHSTGLWLIRYTEPWLTYNIKLLKQTNRNKIITWA